jgi:hypothetical protein
MLFFGRLLVFLVIYFLLCFNLNFISCYYWHTNNINRTNTTIALQYLSSSYSLGCPIQELRDWSCNWCVQYQNQYLKPYSFIYSDNTDAFSSVLIDNIQENIVIIFNYTEFDTLVSDLLYTNCNSTLFNDLESFNDICIGDYYEKLYTSINNALYNNILNAIMEYPNYSFVFTGYSIGGALASIAALDLKLKFKIKVNNVYTFGSPRVGNLEFTKIFYKYIGNTFRLTNNNDIIPRLPLKEKGFNHLSTEVWRKSDKINIIGNTYTNCINTNGFNEYKKCIESLDETELNLEDHFDYMGLHYKCKN